MSQYDNSLEKFENKFKEFENKAREIVSKNQATTFSTELTESAADFVHDILSDKYEHTIYMTSVALFVDDIFEVCFSKKSDRMDTDRKWNHFANKEGFLGYCCFVHKYQDLIKVVALNDKLQMAKHEYFTQKILLEDDKLCAFYVAPVSISDNIIGSLQISFIEEKKVNSKDDKDIKETLLWCAEKLTWILLTEQSKHKAIIDAAGAISRTLDIKNEYQANHSKNVAKLSVHFFHEIVANFSFIRKQLDESNNDRPQSYTTLQVRLAALLHDTGKLIMSDESFEKVDNIEDYSKRRLHAYYTDMVLGYSTATENISLIAAYHHEKIATKNGYPYGVEINNDMILEQVISFADMIDSTARERSSPINNNNRVERKTFAEILKKLLSGPEFSNRYTYELYVRFICILKSYTEPKNRKLMNNEIKILLGLNDDENANPEPKIIQTEKEREDKGLSYVIKQAIKYYPTTITNRWVSALVIIVPDNFNPEEIFGNTNKEGTFYVASPIFNNGKRQRCNKYFLTADGCENPVTVKYKRSSNYPTQYYAAFISPHEMPREISYAICENLSTCDFVKSMSVAFCDKELLYSGNKKTTSLRGELEKSSTKMDSRWQLLPASKFYDPII